MKPWYKSRDDACFATLGLDDGSRRQLKLCEGRDNESEVRAQLHFDKTGQVSTPTKPTVADAFEAFLDWTGREKKAATYEHYHHFRQSFVVTGVAAKPVSD